MKPMSFVVSCGSQQFTITGDEALIGRDPACTISLPDDIRLSARHAALRQVGGRWLIEARADAMLQVGNSAPSRLGWLSDGDVVRLTPNGPELLVNPPTPVSAPVAASASPVVSSAAAAPTPAAKVEAPIAAPAAVWKRQPTSTTTADGNVPRTASSVWEDWKKPAVISAIIVLGAGTLWGVISNLGSKPNEVVSVPASKEREPDRVFEEPAVASRPQPDKPAAPASATDSIYAVLVASEDRQQVYQVGTAWAVSPQRLVTSGAVVLAVERLRQNLGIVMVRHPGSKTDYFVAERAHPKFVELTSNATQLQTQLLELDRQLEKTTDDAEKQTLEKKLQELDLQLIAQFRETMYFDIGVLEVRDRLPHVLPQADTPAVKGQRLRLLGVPFPEDEQLLNPDRPPQHREVAGQLLALLPEFGAIAPPIIFNATLKDLQGHQWSGAPVVNAAGQVVAVFSRLAPPDVKAAPDPSQLRPHATDIRALRELIP